MEFELELERAREAMRDSEWGRAVAHLTRVCETEPRWAEIRTDLGRALRLSRKLEQAEALLASTVARFPTYAWASFEYGMVAFYRQDWDTAIARFARLREEFPDELAGYAAGGEALIGAGRLDEAERLLNEAMHRFPDHVWPAYNWASVALKRGDWEEAVRRAAEVRRRFPDHPQAYALGGEALIESGRPNEAEALFQEAQQRFPSHQGTTATLAKLASPQRERSEQDSRQPGVDAPGTKPLPAAELAGERDSARRWLPERRWIASRRK